MVKRSKKKKKVKVKLNPMEEQKRMTEKLDDPGVNEPGYPGRRKKKYNHLIQKLNVPQYYEQILSSRKPSKLADRMQVIQDKLYYLSYPSRKPIEYGEGKKL